MERQWDRRTLTSRLAAWVVAFLAALSTDRIAPFTSNQETYLAHADTLTKDGAILRADWFTRTRDPVPLFTQLAGPVVAAGSWAMWLVNAALGAVLLVAMAHIARDARRDWAGRECGSLLGWVSLFGFVWVVVPGLLRSCIFDGLAQQRAYSEYLQPSNAGVLLVAAVWLALARRSFLAVLLGAAAAWLHPTYALSSLVLTAGVCVADAKFDHSWRRGVYTALAGLVAVAPPIVSSMRQFAATSPALAARAAYILVAERLPHHALLSAWGKPEAALRLAPLGLALVLARGRVRVLLTVWGALALVATVLVIFIGRPELLLLFPWRVTVWLTPAAAALVLGHAVAGVLKERAKWILVCLAPLLAACSYRFTRRESGAPDDRRGVALAREIQASERQRWTLLVPLDWEAVRLNAPAAVYVDFKSHPYKDVEVLAWWDRVTLARAVYAANAKSCGALGALLETQPRLGFVLAPPSLNLASCAPLAVAGRDGDGILYRVRRRTSAE